MAQFLGQLAVRSVWMLVAVADAAAAVVLEPVHSFYFTSITFKRRITHDASIRCLSGVIFQFGVVQFVVFCFVLFWFVFRVQIFVELIV